MKGVPEGECFETAGGCPREFEGDFDGIRPACGKEYFAQGPRGKVAQRFRQFYGRLTGKAAGREAQLVHLLRDRGLQARMAVANVMDAVAVEIHVTPPGRVLDPYAIGTLDGGEAPGSRRSSDAGMRPRLAGVGLCVPASSTPQAQICRAFDRFDSPSVWTMRMSRLLLHATTRAHRPYRSAASSLAPIEGRVVVSAVIPPRTDNIERINTSIKSLFKMIL